MERYQSQEKGYGKYDYGVYALCGYDVRKAERWEIDRSVIEKSSKVFFDFIYFFHGESSFATKID